MIKFNDQRVVHGLVQDFGARRMMSSVSNLVRAAVMLRANDASYAFTDWT
jgi:hypothetical protein